MRSNENRSPTLFDFTIHFSFHLISMQRTIGLSQQLLKLQLPWKFSNTITLRFQFALSYFFVMFSWYFNNFLWHSATVLLTGSSSVAKESVTFFCLLRTGIYLYLVNFYFQAHRSKLKNFQTHKRDHSNKLLFVNSHFLHFLQYFQWGYAI